MDSEIKVYRDTFKKDISFWIDVKIRYENFYCSVIVDNMKRAAFCLKNYGSFKGRPGVLALCALGFKKDGKVRKLERYMTQRSIPVWVVTSRHTEYENDVSVQAGGTFRHALLIIFHHCVGYSL